MHYVKREGGSFSCLEREKENEDRWERGPV